MPKSPDPIINSTSQLERILGEGWSLLNAGRFAAAAEKAQLVLDVMPDNVSALCCKGMADWEAGGPVEDSIVTLKRAVALSPQSAPLLHNLATLEASHGNFAAAAAAFKGALDLRPDDVMAYFGLMQNQRLSEPDELQERMLALYSSGGLSRSEREFVSFALAKGYDDLGQHDRAMHFCLEANWLAGRPWDEAAERARIDTIEQQVNAEETQLARWTLPGIAPVFVVGMPRAGTTLIETILQRHAQVEAVGETEIVLNAWARVAARVAQAGEGARRDALKLNAEMVLHEMSAVRQPDTAVVIDKTPENAFNVGDILSMFKNARIIHVRRHPLDVGVSNLFTRFTRGQGFAFNEKLLGERIAQTSKVMALWKQAFPDNILDVSYEWLVSSQEQVTRKMLAFIGLDWDPACLDTNQDRRQINTASQWQARQQVHTNSVRRYKRYEEWLTPRIDAMGGWEWIDAEVSDQCKTVKK